MAAFVFTNGEVSLKDLARLMNEHLPADKGPLIAVDGCLHLQEEIIVGGEPRLEKKPVPSFEEKKMLWPKRSMTLFGIT